METSASISPSSLPETGGCGSTSPYLDEQLPAQRVVVVIREDLRELVESADALPARGETWRQVSNTATVGSPPYPKDSAMLTALAGPCFLGAIPGYFAWEGGRDDGAFISSPSSGP